MNDRIPRRIIQTGREAGQSLQTRATIANLKLLNPDYEYHFFDDAAVEDFIAHEFPQYRTIFERFQFSIERYDFFRYLAVYRYGGFYFDLDVLLAEGISHLLDAGCVFPFEGLTLSRHLRDYHKMDWEIGNYAFGAAAGHPFLAAVIENCVRAQENPEWVRPMLRGFPPMFREEFVVLNSTGPGLISRTFAENPELAAGVTVLFPDDVCDVNQWNLFGSLGVHLMDGSWRTPSSFLRRKVAQYWELWNLRGVLKESRKLGKIRDHRPLRDSQAVARRSA